MRIFRIGAIGVSAALAVACAALTGVGDYAIDDALDTDGSATQGSSSGTSGVLPPPPRDPDGGSPPPAPPPTCTCVDKPPADWSQPTLFLENDGAPERACPTGLASTKRGGVPSDTGCTPCTCAIPQAACKEFQFQPHLSNNCGTQCAPVVTIGTECAEFRFCNTNGSTRLSDIVTGACAPDGGARRPGFGRSSNACAFEAAPPPNGGCTADTQVCAPKSAGAPEAKTCITHEGDVPCPAAGPYVNRAVFHAGTNDTRVCSACTCGSQEAISCTGGVISMYNSNDCQGAALGTSTMALNSCSVMNGASGPRGSAKITTPGVPDGGCPPAGGTVTSGTVAGQNPWTACCL